MKEILIATQNKGKLKEYNAALNPLGYNCISLNDVNFNGEIEENGLTFFDNAYIKAKTISDLFNKITIGDDSGLIVKALPFELGVKSKRFSKEATDKANNKLLLEKLDKISNREAYFETALVIYFPNGEYKKYQGTVNGRIARDYLGHFGFGYDPLFIVDELNIRMAELQKEEKNRISHRGKAIKKLIEDIKNENIII